MLVRGLVFERRLPPGLVAILVLTGLPIDVGVLPLLVSGWDETYVLPRRC